MKVNLFFFFCAIETDHSIKLWTKCFVGFFKLTVSHLHGDDQYLVIFMLSGAKPKQWTVTSAVLNHEL